MKSIVVTGGSGKAGRAVIRHLTEAGFDVLNLDLVKPAEDLPGRFCPTDLTDYGQVVDTMTGADAVVHLAAIPAPSRAPKSEIFRINMLSTYHIFQAAMLLKLKKVVWASSETCFGLPFDRVKPYKAPLDEKQPPSPESVYSLTKILGEEMARQYHRWTGIPFIGLRLSNVIEPHEYSRFESWQNQPRSRAWNLWGYIDARDVGLACECALKSDFQGAEFFTIAAADTVMQTNNQELMEEVFPEVPLDPETTGNETLLSINRAREVLKFEPRHSWKD